MLLAVTERSNVAEARRFASQAAVQQGFDDGDVGRVAIIATELATNLVKHAGGGEIAIASMMVRGRDWNCWRWTRAPVFPICLRR